MSHIDNTEALSSPSGRIAWIMAQLASITGSITRLESRLSQEVSDLKNEQIAELRASHGRIADDQRRLWEAVRLLELDRSANDAASKAARGSNQLWVSVIVAFAVAAFTVTGQFIVTLIAGHSH